MLAKSWRGRLVHGLSIPINAEALKGTKASGNIRIITVESCCKISCPSVELAIKSTYCWDIQLYPEAPRICSLQHILCHIYLFS